MSFISKTSILIISIGFSVVSGLTPAFAGDASGTWLRDSGTSKVKIAPCGDALCGTVVWESSPKKDVNNPDESKRDRSVVGTRVFFNMKPNGEDKWSGSAYNPEDGKTYSGGMSLNGSSLTTKGCVMGGLICRSVSWSKAN